MWTYTQANGHLSHDGEFLAIGYSGAPGFKNDWHAEHMEDKGPIPRGRWKLGAVFDSEKHGPLCIRLLPQPGTNTFGRAGFLVHGDSIAAPGTASHGCIILPRAARIKMAHSGDEDLEVV